MYKFVISISSSVQGGVGAPGSAHEPARAAGWGAGAGAGQWVRHVRTGQVHHLATRADFLR